MNAFISIYCDQNGYTEGEENKYDIEAELAAQKDEAMSKVGEDNERPSDKGPTAQQRKRQET